MSDDKHSDDQNLFDKLIAVLLRQSWLEVLDDAGKAVRKTVQGRSHKGVFEVLEYESTLELEDQRGKKATFKKRGKVRGHAGGSIPVRLQDIRPHLAARGKEQGRRGRVQRRMGLVSAGFAWSQQRKRQIGGTCRIPGL
jgi:hypothetical protein